MKKKYKFIPALVLMVLLVAVSGWYLSRHAIPVLQPAGVVAREQRKLLWYCLALSVVIVVPVFGLLGYFAWKYREDNTRATYQPELEGSAKAETIWWLIPSVTIGIISVVIWQSSYALDPYKPIASTKPTMTIQAISMNWKWLFIYPESGVASVNEVAIPLNTPVDFQLTSDTVMTSFWVPSLAGQMYAMPGMMTHLNVLADRAGTYQGATANISGKGFADMTFKVKALDNAAFTAWTNTASRTAPTLTPERYTALAKPSTVSKPQFYSAVSDELYDTIVMKYMYMERGGSKSMEHMHGVTE